MMASPKDEWLEALPYPVFGLSDDYEFVFVNYAAEVFFERSRHFLLKTKLTEFFLEDSPIRHKVISIGRLANKAMGFAGMQTVMQAAYMEAYSKDVPDWTVEAHQRSRSAISELNYVWHGIGDWMQ